MTLESKHTCWLSDSSMDAARAQDKKSAPLKLALLVGCGIMLPLGVAAWFLFRTQKYHGPNNVAQETLDIFCRHAPASRAVPVYGNGRLAARQSGRPAAGMRHAVAESRWVAITTAVAPC